VPRNFAPDGQQQIRKQRRRHEGTSSREIWVIAVILTGHN
jgi:hypothetical protein